MLTKGELFELLKNQDNVKLCFDSPKFLDGVICEVKILREGHIELIGIYSDSEVRFKILPEMIGEYSKNQVYIMFKNYPEDRFLTLELKENIGEK